MKKLVALILMVTLLFSFTACAKEEKNPNVADIMSKIKEDVEFPDMSEISTADIGFYIQLKSDDIEQLSYIIAGSGVTADEVLIVKMKDGIDITGVKALFETRKESQTTLFEPYAPDEMPKIESAVIETKGQYAIFAVTSDNAKVKKIFTDAV